MFVSLERVPAASLNLEPSKVPRRKVKSQASPLFDSDGDGDGSQPNKQNSSSSSSLSLSSLTADV